MKAARAEGNHLVGATYAGALGAVDAHGQQDDARMAAAAAIKASFIMGTTWFGFFPAA
jgi:hypothetical protein